MSLPILKFIRMVGHLLTGSVTILLLFPHLDRRERGHRVVRWSAQFLKILGVRLELIGRPPSVRGGGVLLAANHVSWLDIHLLHSLLPARFISKVEVRSWPLFGFLARASGTVFLEREKKSDAMRVNQLMADHLRDGDCLALFPEGTTSDGADLLPFYPSLFQPAVDARAQVWPVRIRYLKADGGHCAEAAYFGGMTLVQSVMQVLRMQGLRAQVEFLPVIATQGQARRDLARAAEAAIRATFSAAAGSAPESTVRLPA
jgi:1-acyl-sn-glycerol-3-phosphate acyltransferase